MNTRRFKPTPLGAGAFIVTQQDGDERYPEPFSGLDQHWPQDYRALGTRTRQVITLLLWRMTAGNCPFPHRGTRRDKVCVRCGNHVRFIPIYLIALRVVLSSCSTSTVR